MFWKRSTWFVTLAVVGLVATACAENDSDGTAGGDTAGDGTATATESSGMSGMAGHDMSEDVPFDLAFIDSMIEHHRGAIDMAEQARVAAEHDELRAMADDIVEAQVDEIAQMETWRAEWYPGEFPTDGMDMPMGDMEISDDESIPFDQRFITAMVAHHEGAIGMAESALADAEHEEIRELAEAIIEAQEAEIEQLRAWEAEWFTP